MKTFILWLMYVLCSTAYIAYFSETDHPFIMMVASWIGTAIAAALVQLLSLLMNMSSFFLWKRDHDASLPSPATAQGCTPEGGVSAIRADVNFTGGTHE
ncbi:MAG: hypothetical protein GYB41_00710 [Oceanospirillales bacterium]|nr:hypothetical protein [Oceanospirillales bacterium]